MSKAVHTVPAAHAWAFAQIERKAPRAVHRTLKKQWTRLAMNESEQTANGWLAGLVRQYFASPVPGGFDAGNEDLRDMAQRQAEEYRRLRLAFEAVAEYLQDTRLPLGEGFSKPAGTIVPLSVGLNDDGLRGFVTQQAALSVRAVAQHYGVSCDDMAAVYNRGVYGALLAKIAAQGFPVDEMFAGRRDGMTAAEWAQQQEANMRRMACRRFWRKWFKKINRRMAENAVRALGGVSNRRALYVSNNTYRQFQRHRATQAALMQMLMFVNELGEEFTLAQLHEASVSNPKLRRVELMTRIAGFEWFAQQAGHVGEFVTLTCPSRFHAAHFGSGARNEKYDGSTPRDAAAYLQGVWAKIRAALANKKVPIYGFRVTEPHHDGTPHWHLLLFMPQDKQDTFRRVVARYACADSRSELNLHYQDTKGQANKKRKAHFQAACKLADLQGQPRPAWSEFPQRASHWAAADFWQQAGGAVFGRVKKRVDFVAIDWRKGTAAGYIAKYIAKNVDGKNARDESVGEDFEARADAPQDLADSVGRVLCWASTHGIRQFQQIGGPPVTVWRELRRLGGTEEDEAFNDALALAAAAADRGDWGRFVSIMGGIDIKRAERPVQLYKEETDVPTQYGEMRPPVIRGVLARETGELKITHIHEWVLKQVSASAMGGKAAPWTGVNNCTFSEAPVHQEKKRDFSAVYRPFDFNGRVAEGTLLNRPPTDWVKPEDVTREDIIQSCRRSGVKIDWNNKKSIADSRIRIARAKNIKPCINEEALQEWLDVWGAQGDVSGWQLEEARMELAEYLVELSESMANMITPAQAEQMLRQQQAANEQEAQRQEQKRLVRRLEELAPTLRPQAGRRVGIIPALPVFRHADTLPRKRKYLPLTSYQTADDVLAESAALLKDVQAWMDDMAAWDEFYTA